MVTDHFRSHAEGLGAIEVGGDKALRLLSDAKTMLEQTTVDLEKQIRLKNSDRQMYKVKISYSHIINYVY